MEKCKKIVSAVLSVMMIIGMFAVIPFTASAEVKAASVVTASTNLTDAVKEISYGEADNQLVVTYYLKSGYYLTDYQCELTYDSSVLKFSDLNSYEVSVPNTQSGAVMNSKINGYVYFNGSDIKRFYDFKTEDVFINVIFDIVGKGPANVDLDVEVLTATPATTFSEYRIENDIEVVTDSLIVTNCVDCRVDGKASHTEQPVPTTAPATTEAPTTVAPVTDPPTTEPTTAPVSNTIRFTDNQSWGNVYAYFWSDTAVELGGKWPGLKMTKYETNDYGYNNYKVDIPSGAEYVIFSNGSAQTVDIKLTGAVGYYTDGTSTDGKLNVFAWPDTETTTPATSATVVTDPVSDKKTIRVGVISYVYDETKSQASSYQVHYWNNGGLSGDANCTSLNTTAKKSVGSSYWGGAEQTFYMYQAQIPAEATGYKFHIGDRWFGEDGNTANSNTVYAFNYSGDKAMYANTVIPTTPVPTTAPPTTVPPTTAAPTTEPVTTQPVTTVPSEYSDYSIKGNITSMLKKSSAANTVEAAVDLPAGTYSFIIQNDVTGVKYGRKEAVTDTMTKKMFGANWGYCTFTATGGSYTFTYNTKYNVLTIAYDSSTAGSFSDAKLGGHIAMAMKDAGSGIIKNTIDLPVGVYNFGIADGDNFYGRMTTYTDFMPNSIVGNRWGFCKLNVTSPARFEFTYDLTKKYMMVVKRSADDSDYLVTGTNMAFMLKNTANANIAEGTVTLDKGSYDFKISNGSDEYGRKATYTDAVNNAMFGKGWDSCTLNASGGTYKFSFNTKTKYLTVKKV